MIAVFTGGTGGTKLVQGLQQVVVPSELTVIVNTGDDIEWWGLHVSPDVDSVLYGLAGLLSTDRGWGVHGDSFRCLERMRALGHESWFSLGDLDLATHLSRTMLLRAGKTLSQATAEIATKLGIAARVLPMTDDPVATLLDTDQGRLTFQEYFVRERYRPKVRAVHFDGARQSRPAPGVLDSILTAEAIIFAPSNPVTSIGPILAVPGIVEALRVAKSPKVVVSPIVGQSAVSGPAGELMKAIGFKSSLEGVLWAYFKYGFSFSLLGDITDEQAAYDLMEAPVCIGCANIIMKTIADRRQLAELILEQCKFANMMRKPASARVV